MANQITYKPVIIARQRHTDGTYNVKIRVTFKRESRYISSNITATDKDLDGKGNLKGKALIKANALIATFYDYANDLNYFSLQDMDVDDVVRYIHRKALGSGTFEMDLFEFAEEEVIPTKAKGTQDTYHVALNAFRRYLGADRLDINELTKEMLQGFADYLDKEPKVYHQQSDESKKKVAHPKKKGAAAYTYTNKIRYIYEAAQYKYNDEDNGIVNIPRNPFAKLRINYSPEARRTARDPGFIQRIISYTGKCTPTQRMALDIYILSFALMGMNAVDMMAAAPAKKGVIIYNRAKTKDRRHDRAEHRVKIDPRIRKLVEKYRDPEGKRLFNFYLYWRDNEALCQSLRCIYASWCASSGEAPFTLYSARHSWATIARSKACGIDKATIDDCLCHIGDHELVDVYAEKDWQVLWDANKKVLDLFDWSAIQ